MRPELPSVAAAFTLAVAAAPPALAQLSVEASLGGAHDAFAYSDADPEGRLATAGSLGSQYLFAGGRARVFYSLDAATYSTPGDWSTLRHDLGGVYRADLSDSGRLRLFLGSTATWHRNGEAWSAAGYRALGGMANVEYRPGGGATLRLGYRIDARDFPDIPALNQVEQDAFVSALVNVQTRTTLIGEVSLGAKSYEGEAILLEVSPTAVPSGERQGRGGMGPAVRPVQITLTRDGERAGRVAWRVRVAQSLADRTGLSLEYGARHSFGETPPALITTPPHFYDDGVYDDPYASDARSIRANVKQIFTKAGVLRGWVAWQWKNYRATPALDLDGEPVPDRALREDRLWRAGAGWRVPLFPERTGPLGLDLDLGYAYTRHHSNDAFYDYSSHAIGLALSVAY